MTFEIDENQLNPKNNWYNKWWVSLILPLILAFIILAFIIYRLEVSNSEPKQNQQALVAQQARVTPAPVPATEPIAVALPPIETQFIKIVSTAQQDASGADNNMKKGGIKSIRDKSICKLLTSLHIKDWIATVDTIDSNSDGKGVLAVSLAKDITAQTWNNSLSDISDQTLLEPSSALFKAASNLNVGQFVKFSGKFFSDDDNCIEEGSLTLDGKLQSPDFIFKFSQISVLN